MEVSYYKVKIDNRIAAISTDRLLSDEIENGSNPAVVRDAEGKIDVMYSFDQNMASLETSGFDFKANYTHEPNIGDFSLRGEESYVEEFVEITEAGADPFDYSGLQDYPEWRANMTLDWKYDNFGAAWSTYYIGKQESGAEEFNNPSLAPVASYFKHNAQVSYTHDWNGKVTFGVNNIFDREAPKWYDGFYDYRDASTALYDVLGRTIFLKVEQTF